MKIKEQALIDLMTVSSMGVRMVPQNRQPVQMGNLYEMYSSSAETNVLNISAALGLRTKVLSKFVSDSPIAQFIKSELRKRNIEYEGLEVAQGDPWGYRHQINIADSGYGSRGPRVYNDRAGEVGRTLSARDYDLERLFAREGCRALHLSGLIGAMSAETTACCLEIVRYAKAQGTLISFDLNHRASFWRGRETELRDAFSEIASLVDILVGNEEDFQLALGIPGPEITKGGFAAKIEGFQQMMIRAAEKYPNISVFANTLREVNSANAHDWGAILWHAGQWYLEPPREIMVLDRIGGGDGFTGGLLYGILRKWAPADWLKFGWATGALAVTVLTDYATPADEEQVWSIYHGNARVRR